MPTPKPTTYIVRLELTEAEYERVLKARDSLGYDVPGGITKLFLEGIEKAMQAHEQAKGES